MSWISPETVLINVPAQDWQEAVQAAGHLLVKAGAAEPRYLDAMIRTVAELGPYIVLVPGMAMPHARPEDGALKVGFAAITLDHPIEFGNLDNDPVRLVIAFCAPDSDAHIQSLTQLARALGEPGFVERAVAATTTEELAEILNRGKQQP
ncbi:MAG: PTS sugar transporter subunit IIA [Peptococcaceae bacterium]|nr:PTS sugar transporter subunit IIA [Peptococcaceae bacterium]